MLLRKAWFPNNTIEDCRVGRSWQLEVIDVVKNASKLTPSSRVLEVLKSLPFFLQNDLLLGPRHKSTPLKPPLSTIQYTADLLVKAFVVRSRVRILRVLDMVLFPELRRELGARAHFRDAEDEGE